MSSAGACSGSFAIGSACEILLYLGLLALGISLAAAAVWIIGCAFLHVISRYEERQLLERLGVEHRQYMADVPMWIPRIRRIRRGEG